PSHPDLHSFPTRRSSDLTASSQADLREAIMQERRVELAFENKRWHDLTRTDTYLEVITAFGARAKANPKAYYYQDGWTFRSHALDRKSTRLNSSHVKISY